MIVKVTDKKTLNQFIYFVTKLYRNHPLYVYPIFSALKKELASVVLNEKTYTAILCIQNDETVGRLLYTQENNQKQAKMMGYFSFFDSIDSVDVAQELLSYMESDLLNKGVQSFEGTYSPYDPDTRRGILVNGFDQFPSMLTSYNYEYYGTLLEACGYQKAYDTVTLEAKINPEVTKKLFTIEKNFTNHYNVSIDAIDLKNINKEINDIHRVLEEATTELNYQEAPSVEMISTIAKKLKPFINPKLIRIAREVETKEPVGFCLVFPDFNYVFKKTNGKIRPLRMLRLIRKIPRARGMMQYVVPKYQNTGLIGYMYKRVYDEFFDLGIKEFVAGTIMEDNPKAVHAFDKFGAEAVCTYRIYRKDVLQ
jgi:hypothetical protein